MDITRENFEECFPTISKAIDDATFITIDAEFTGLDGGQDCVTCFDTPENRYLKLLQPAKDYIIIQFGLCAFKRLPGDDVRYEVKSFNFFLFPRPSKFNPDVVFSCQNSSLEFIVSQGVEFGKVIAQGLSYLPAEDEKKFRDDLLLKHTKQMQRLSADCQNHVEQVVESGMEKESGSAAVDSLVAVPQSQKAFIDRQLNKVESCLSQRSEEFVVLESCSSFTRKIIYEQLNAKFPDQLLLETVSDDHSPPVIKVIFINGLEHKKELVLKKQSNELEELCNAVGFTKVIRLLHASEKLIIGHNMLLDLMHTINQFWVTLPPDYSSFKELIHQVFPRILDTKHMASIRPFNSLTINSSLQNLYNDLRQNQKIPVFNTDIPDGYPDFSTQTSFHNAAYDAYVTGLCFLHMRSYLGTIKRELSIAEKLGWYENKLYLMRIEDVPYMNLAGDDLTLSREHMFHIQFFNGKKETDVRKLFSPYGKITLKILDSNSALVSMFNKDNCETAKKNLSAMKTWFRLQPFAEWYSKRKSTSPQNNNGTAHRKSSQNLKRSHAQDSKSINSKIPAKKKSKPPSVKSSPTKEKREKTGEGDVADPFNVNHYVQEKKDERNVNPPLFEEPEWD